MNELSRPSVSSIRLRWASMSSTGESSLAAMSREASAIVRKTVSSFCKSVLAVGPEEDRRLYVLELQDVQAFELVYGPLDLRQQIVQLVVGEVQP